MRVSQWPDIIQPVNPQIPLRPHLFTNIILPRNNRFQPPQTLPTWSLFGEGEVFLSDGIWVIGAVGQVLLLCFEGTFSGNGWGAKISVVPNL